MTRQTLFTLIIVALSALVFAACDKTETATTQEDAPDLTTAENLLEEGAQPATDESEDTDEVNDGSSDTPAPLADDLPEGETGHYGAKFTIDDEPISLTNAIALSKESEGPYKIKATIEKVCKKKGCWFTLTSDDVEIPIRVQMKDYGFFVPRNADAADVVVEGTLKRDTISQELAQHFADDEVEGTEEQAQKVDGPQETYQFEATAVEITRG